MENVMHALNEAREEIYIADWWLCPELYLKRPKNDLQYRLDKILLKKAREGVRVYVLLFKEVDFLLGLVSIKLIVLKKKDQAKASFSNL
jgi:phospholipase D1/2